MSETQEMGFRYGFVSKVKRIEDRSVLSGIVTEQQRTHGNIFIVKPPFLLHVVVYNYFIYFIDVLK